MCSTGAPAGNAQGKEPPKSEDSSCHAYNCKKKTCLKINLGVSNNPCVEKLRSYLLKYLQAMTGPKKRRPILLLCTSYVLALQLNALQLACHHDNRSQPIHTHHHPEGKFYHPLSPPRSPSTTTRHSEMDTILCIRFCLQALPSTT